MEAPDGTSVAVKVLLLRSMPRAWKSLELFEREAQTLKALQHPSIPSYIDSFEEDTEDDKKFYIVQVFLNQP